MEALAPTISIVVPLFNERQNVQPLYDQLIEALSGQFRNFEIVLVDDGSADGTSGRLKSLAESDDRVKLVLFRRNYGQTAALQAGIDHAAGDYIVTIDGDLQNDPQDIPMMIEKLDEGYDLVHGWRKDRQDTWLTRRLPSTLANRLISRVTGFAINDLGCTLKAMRREIAHQLELYGEMHRFIPVLADQLGARSVEVITNHRSRKFGESKYGIDRTFRVLLDLLTVSFLTRFFDSPMKLFGRLGLWVSACGICSGFLTILMKLIGGIDMTGNPLLLLSVLATILGVQFFGLGLIGEASIRIYYGQPGHRSYQVRETVNVASAAATVRYYKAA